METDTSHPEKTDRNCGPTEADSAGIPKSLSEVLQLVLGYCQLKIKGVKNEQDEVLERCKAEVQSKPLQSLAIAFIAGYTLSSLRSRRK